MEKTAKNEFGRKGAAVYSAQFQAIATFLRTINQNQHHKSSKLTSFLTLVFP